MEASFARCRVRTFIVAILLSFVTISSAWLYAPKWFTCDNGEVFDSRSFCNNYRNCTDGSDEKPAKFFTYPDNPSSPYMSCDNKYDSRRSSKVCALRRQEYCKGDIECVNQTCDGPCSSHFQCPDSTCWERSTVCDGDPCNDCPAFQQWNNGHGFKCVRNGRMCNLPQLFLWDGIADCDDKSDLCYSSERGDARDISESSSFNNRLCFKCINGSKVISRSSVCDDVIDCPDKSDECLCEKNITECGKIHKFDRKKNVHCTTTGTPIIRGIWRCLSWRSGRWVSVSNKLFCDGKRNCRNIVANKYGERVYIRHDEDPGLCTHRYFCKTKYRRINIPQSKVCDGFVDCINKRDEYPQKKCKGRFYCQALNGAKVSISRSDVCDHIINCDDQSDETNCTNDGRFYCENKQPLFVKKEKVFNGIGDCNDWSDECPSKTKTTNENIFSSRYELIANPILRTVVWIMALLAVFGNLVVMVTEAKTLITTKSQTSAFRTNHLLVLNLSVSDLLMGVYLLMLGVAGARYSGSYCANDLVWRSSGGCTTMGVLVMLSSETSVLTMLLLTVFRLYAVKNPFDASLKPELKTVILSIILSWAISFTIAFIPLTSHLQHFYKTKAWMNDNRFFRNAEVDYSKMEKFMKDFVKFQHELNNKDNKILDMRVDNANSWMDYVDILKTYNYSDYFNISGYFGYYSSNSVCISKLYVTLDDKAWAYSMGIIVFNFLAFMFVAVTYIWIYKKSTSSARQVNERPGNERAAKQNKEMQKKIIRLIITDFFCWIPISIMAFVNLGGAPVPPVIYAVSAIILLPINSSLNPLIYSNAPKLLYDRIRDRLRGVCPRRPQEERQENVVTVANRENLLVVEQESAL